jgi:hypothetical protein
MSYAHSSYRSLSNKDKAKALVPLISKDRSRDMHHFIHIGRILCNMLGGGQEVLVLWKSSAIIQRQHACEEYWPIMCRDMLRYTQTVKELLSGLEQLKKVSFDDINTVKKALIVISQKYERSRDEVSRLNLEETDDLDTLLSKTVDIRSFSQCGYHVGILEHIAKSDSPENFKILVMNHGQIDKIDEVSFGLYNWSMTRRLIMSNDPLASTEESILKLIKASIANVLRGTGRFIMNEGNGIDICKESEFLSICKNTRVPSLCTEKRDVYLYEFIMKHISHLVYEDMEYTPGLVPSHTLNLFRGYRGREVDEIDHNIEVILDHLREIQCNGDTDIYNYLIKWLAYIIQKPAKPNTAILMIGNHGVGKTIFWEFFIRSIIGNRNTYVCSTLDEITSRFNSHIANKRFLLVSECKGSSKHDHDKLKRVITDSTLSIEKKGIESYELASVHCVAITSNHRDHHFIDKDDRRFVVVECSNDKRDAEYFDTLASVMEDYSNDFYTYLYRMDLSDFRPSNIPMSNIKNDIIESNIHPVQQFLTEYVWNDWRVGSLVYKDYLEWCREGNIASVPANKFKIHSGFMIDTRHSRDGVMYKTRKGTNTRT